MRIVVFGLIISLYTCLNVYIGRRMFQWLKEPVPQANGMLFGFTYSIIALSLILSYLLPPSFLRQAAAWIGSFWMGTIIYLLIFFLAADLVLLLGRAGKMIPSPVPPNIRFAAGSAALLLTVLIVGYGTYNATQVKRISYDVQTSDNALPGGMKIVLASDLHLGAVGSEKRLEKIVEEINRENPDLVCLTGDIFNDDYAAIQNPEKAIRLLQSIQSEFGVYACLGNHDAGSGFDRMLSFLEESDIHLLNDEFVVIDERLILAGRLDPSPIGGFDGLQRKSVSEVFASLEHTNMPVVVMDHTPSLLGEYEARKGGEGVDLILSGHTHRGQVFPGSLFTRQLFEVDYGYYQKDSESPHVIVTSGAGTWGMPMRVGTNNEVVTITLK